MDNKLEEVNINWLINRQKSGIISPSFFMLNELGLNIYHSPGLPQAESPRFKPLVEPLDISRRLIYQKRSLDEIRDRFTEFPAIAVVGMNGTLADPETRIANPQAARALEVLASAVPVVVWTTTPRTQALAFLKAYDLSKYVSLLIAKENYVFQELNDDSGQMFVSAVLSPQNFTHLTEKQKKDVVYPDMNKVHQGSFKLPRLIWDFSKKILHFEDQTEWQKGIQELNRQVFPDDRNYHFVQMGRFNPETEPDTETEIQPIFSQEVVFQALAEAEIA